MTRQNDHLGRHGILDDKTIRVFNLAGCWQTFSIILLVRVSCFGLRVAGISIKCGEVHLLENSLGINRSWAMRSYDHISDCRSI